MNANRLNTTNSMIYDINYVRRHKECKIFLVKQAPSNSANIWFKLT